MREVYLFHTEWNDGDADTALFGDCPEVVRVDNCMAWRPMSVVMELLPRVVHSKDASESARNPCCGSSITLCLWHCSRGECYKRIIDVYKIRRSTYYMYPEDALGGGVQSASIMWERIENLFQSIRDLMKTHENARSESFSIPWTAACMSFIEVRFFVFQCIHCNEYISFFSCQLQVINAPG